MATYTGTSGNDTFNGGALIVNDSISGLAGNDSLVGGSGTDTIDGGAGNDTLNGSSGTDTLTYATATSAITISLALTTAQVTGGSGTDTITGFEKLIGSSYNDLLSGSLLNDTIIGGSGNDTLNGSDGNDSLDGGTGADSLTGGNGNDTLIGGTDNSNDTLDGGADRDTVSYATATAAVNVNLGSSVAQNTVGAGSDKLVSIEDLIGSAFADTLITANVSTQQTLTGGSGDDMLINNGTIAFSHLYGGVGNDTLSSDLAGSMSWMTGGAGDDLYKVTTVYDDGDLGTVIDSTGSRVVELAGEGTDSVVIYSNAANLTGTGSSWTAAANIENVSISGTAAGLTLIGNELDNVLAAGTGAATLNGGDGNDTLNGGAGNDVLYAAAGVDVLAGGTSNDTYCLDTVFDDTLTENAGEGTDTVVTTYSFSLGANFENLTLANGYVGFGGHLYGNDANNLIFGNTGSDRLEGGIGNDTLSASDGDDVLEAGDGDDALYGGYGNDALNGGAGVDFMDGNWGDDSYVVDDSGDVMLETISKGYDTVFTMVDYDFSIFLSAYLSYLYVEEIQLGSGGLNITGSKYENLIWQGSGDDVIYGMDGADTIYGDLGNDAIYASDYGWSDDGDADSLYGGAGDDTFYINALDQVFEDAGEGIDTVYSTSSHTLADNFEHLQGLGNAAPMLLAGNAAANTISTHASASTLEGYAGNDTLEGGFASTLTGGDGSDTYRVAFAENVVVETNATVSTGGTDLIILDGMISLTLAANVENGQVWGNVAGNLTGNSLANTLFASTADNILDGGSDRDTVSYIDSLAAVAIDLSLTTAQATGGSGSDTLLNIENITGSDFADLLTGRGTANLIDGGKGADTMAGGGGNDTYCVRQSGDVVTESLNSGTDTVRTYISSWTLGSNIENGRIMTGNAANLTGNAFDNLLQAGTGNNVLTGDGGNDTASYAYGVSGAGVSVTLASTVAQATGGSGSDTLAGIENLVGSNYADNLGGNSANNVITGGKGRDTLAGNGGNDTFDFNALNETGTGSDARDLISDFNSGDRIDLSTLDADTASTTDNAFSVFIASAATFTAAGQLQFSAGVLYGNTDADSAAEFSIAFNGIVGLALADIIL